MFEFDLHTLYVIPRDFRVLSPSVLERGDVSFGWASQDRTSAGLTDPRATCRGRQGRFYPKTRRYTPDLKTSKATVHQRLFLVPALQSVRLRYPKSLSRHSEKRGLGRELGGGADVRQQVLSSKTIGEL